MFVLQLTIGIDNVLAVQNETPNYVSLISISLETVVTLLGDFNVLRNCMFFFFAANLKQCRKVKKNQQQSKNSEFRGESSKIIR